MIAYFLLCLLFVEKVTIIISLPYDHDFIVLASQPAIDQPPAQPPPSPLLT